MHGRRSLRETLGVNAKAFRKAKRMSQPKLAEAIGRLGRPIDQTTVGRIERAQIPTTIDSIESLAKGLGVDAWQLLVADARPDAPPALSGDGLTADEYALVEKYRAATARWKLSLQHLAAIPTEQQEEISEGTVALLAKVAARAAPDSSVALAYGKPSAPAPKAEVLREPRHPTYVKKK